MNNVFQISTEDGFVKTSFAFAVIISIFDFVSVVMSAMSFVVPDEGNLPTKAYLCILIAPIKLSAIMLIWSAWVVDTKDYTEHTVNFAILYLILLGARVGCILLGSGICCIGCCCGKKNNQVAPEGAPLAKVVVVQK